MVKNVKKKVPPTLTKQEELLQEALEYPKRTPIIELRRLMRVSAPTVEEVEVITERAIMYLELCEKTERTPTFQGLALSIGVNSNTIKDWMKDHPLADSVIFLSRVMDYISDGIQVGALEKKMNANTSALILKTQFGFDTDKTVTIKHEKTYKSLAQIEHEINEEIMDADFTEKSENEF